jgi:hypothetical protein
MACPASPWYRSDRDTWYEYCNGRPIKLCSGKANKKEAYRRFLELEDDTIHETSTERCKAKDLLAAFLRHAELTGSLAHSRVISNNENTRRRVRPDSDVTAGTRSW